MPMPRSIVKSLALALVGLGLFAACNEASVATPCSDIPEGGCPRSRGVACADPACEAVYLCRPNNVWELEQRCPPRTGAPAASLADGGEADASAPIPADAAPDAPPGAFGGPGCPGLQAPECALGLALVCGTGCCGCEDLFVCEDDGWTLWGTCADGGVVHTP